MTASDPIDDHVAALALALRGPARARARVLTEVRDGLTDAAAALAHADDPRGAAVRDFGPVDVVAAAFQRELSIAQARRTAGVVALAAPFLAACWFIVTLPAHRQGLPPAVGVLAAHLGGVTAATALLAAAALAATGTPARLLPTPHRLPMMVAWTGTAACVALAVSAVVLTATSALAGNWPLSALIGVVTIASHARVAASARACRACARLPRA
jgi:hypothetical protein